MQGSVSSKQALQNVERTLRARQELKKDTPEKGTSSFGCGVAPEMQPWRSTTA